MRNLLLASSALVAAVALAGTASAQNVSVQNNQNNTAQVNATSNIGPITVTGTLDSDTNAIGNLYQVQSNVGQGIAEIGSNNGGINSPQVNTGNIAATTVVVGTTAATMDVNTTAAANVINLEGVIAQNAGNRVLGQNNSASVTSNLSVNGSAGTMRLNSAAIGNLVSVEGSSSIGLGTGQNGGGAFTQTNTGAISARNDFTGFNNGATNLTVQVTAAGNVVNADAPSVGISVTQNNGGGGQFATANAPVDGGTGGVYAIGSTALGNLVAPTGGTFGTATGLFQNNSTQQVATTNVNGVAAFNGNSASASATAAGNVISIAQTGAVQLNGAQVNNGSQTAELNFRATNASGAGAFTGTATSIGNLVSADLATGSFGSGLSQSNGGPVLATVNLSGGAFGSNNSFSSLAAGNVLQVETLGSVEGINGAANQGNFNSVTARTNVTGGTFGNLAAGATAVGNLTSVTIR